MKMSRTLFLSLVGAVPIACSTGGTRNPSLPFARSPEYGLSIDPQLAARAGFTYILHPNGKDFLYLQPDLPSQIPPQQSNPRNLSTIVTPNCGIDNPCGTPAPGGGGGGADGFYMNELQTIGSVTVSTTFPPSSNPSSPSFSSYNYTGGGGVPQYPVSPRYGVPKREPLACAVAGADLFKTGVDIRNWLAVNTASVSKANADLIGVEIGAAVTTGELLSVCILALGPAEFALLLLSIGIVAFAAFELIRCAVDGVGD